MKSIKWLNTNLPRWSLISIIFIAISIACSTSKSAGVPVEQSNNLSATQSSTPSPVSAVTQDRIPCTLKTPESPVIDGLKLGMTVDEVLVLFPGSKDDAELQSALSVPAGRFGNSNFLITPSKYSNAAHYREVSRLTFSLLDGRVSSFTISYNGPEWPHVDKFVEKFVKDKNLLPADQWEAYAAMDSQMKTLTCDGFSIRIFAGGEGGNLNYVLVEDLEADKKLKERRKKAREQTSPTQSS